jgi:hypothetical protein
VLATWPCLPVSSDWRPRWRLCTEPERVPIVWPSPVKPAPIPVTRCCIDCDAPLPEPTGPGRPRLRCDACRDPEPIKDWTRPVFTPSGHEAVDPWLRRQLRVPALPWEPPDDRAPWLKR